jgi:5-carboxymethyl-2-hydroxymuconate isomerase
MPHFIIDCSDDLFAVHNKQDIMQIVFDAAKESGLLDVQCDGL